MILSPSTDTEQYYERQYPTIQYKAGYAEAKLKSMGAQFNPNIHIIPQMKVCYHNITQPATISNVTSVW